MMIDDAGGMKGMYNYTLSCNAFEAEINPFLVLRQLGEMCGSCSGSSSSPNRLSEGYIVFDLATTKPIPKEYVDEVGRKGVKLEQKAA